MEPTFYPILQAHLKLFSQVIILQRYSDQSIAGWGKKAMVCFIVEKRSNRKRWSTNLKFKKRQVMIFPVDRSTPHKYSRMTKNDQRKYFYEEKTITGCEQFILTCIVHASINSFRLFQWLQILFLFNQILFFFLIIIAD